MLQNLIEAVIKFLLSIFSKREPNPKALLRGIRQVEANGNYDAFYGKAKNKDKPKLTSMSFKEVLNWQDDFVKRGSPSSAVGAYQFIRATLREYLPKAGLSLGDKFTPNAQDLLAEQLLIRRGYNSYKTGSLSATEFANRLAREWASLPVMNRQKGHTRVVERGQSYYAGDGLNKALVSPEKVLDWIKGSR